MCTTDVTNVCAQDVENDPADEGDATCATATSEEAKGSERTPEATKKRNRERKLDRKKSDLGKKKKKKPLALADDYDAPDNRLSQLEQMEDAEKRSTVNTSIQQLPDRQKQALILCFYEGLSNKEASEIMGMRTRALQSLLIRAKDNLEKSLRIGEYDG